MHKRLITLVLVLLFVALIGTACAPAAPAEEEPMEEPMEEPAEEEAAEEPAEEVAEEPAEEAAADEPCVKAAFVYWSPIADGGWTKAHDDGRVYLEENLDCVETAYVESVQTAADTERVLRQYARDGFDVIYTAGFDYMDPTVNVAEEFPDTYFENCSGFKLADNAGNYFAAMEEARYLTGIIAGHMTETNEIGYLAAFPIPEVVRGINGFALGVKSVNPDATVHVIWTNTWYDPGTEREAAEALLDLGADVLAQHQDSTAFIDAAKERGAWAIGYDADMSWAGPETVLTSAVFNWGAYYLHKTTQVMNGEWVQEEWWGTMSELAIDIAPMGDMVPQEVQDEVMVAREAIINNELNVFAGPLVDNEGNEMVPEGEALSHGDALGMSWFVDNVSGSVD